MMNNLKSDIIKTVTSYNNYYEMLSSVIKQYFEENDGGWKFFNGWKFSNDGENIIIHYSYEEFGNNTETYMETSDDIVPLDEILEYSKIYNKLQK